MPLLGFVTLQLLPSDPCTNHLYPPGNFLFCLILKSHFAHLARYTQRSERSRIQIGKSWKGFHVFTKGHLWGMEAGFQAGSLSLKSFNDVSCRSQEQLYSLFSFPPRVPNMCSGRVNLKAQMICRSRSFLQKVTHIFIFFFNNTYFFWSLEVYEGLLLVGFLRNVISHSGNMRWHSYSASPHFNSEQYSVIIKRSSFIICFLFAHHLCEAFLKIPGSLDLSDFLTSHCNLSLNISW